LKTGQWAAFARKSGLPNDHPTLSEVVNQLRRFLLAPAFAAARGSRFLQHWPADGPWLVTESEIRSTS